MPTIVVNHMDDPRIAAYRQVREAHLASRSGLFLAEGREIVRTLLTGSLYRARSVLVTPVAREAIADALANAGADLPVYVAEQHLMNQIAGFDIHRGCLAAGDRPADTTLDTLLGRLPGRATVLALESLTNHDNVGAIFRNAVAFGAAAVVLSADCCDPLYRKAIRVSMGGALRVPFARAAGGFAEAVARLKVAGFITVALTPGGGVEARALDARLAGSPRRTLLLGAEGPGLSPGAIAAADLSVRIDMVPSVDSINVATAAAIALHHLFPAGTLDP